MARRYLMPRRVPCPVCCGHHTASVFCDRCDRTGYIDVERELVADIFLEDELEAPSTAAKRRDLVDTVKMFDAAFTAAPMLAQPVDRWGRRVLTLDATPDDVEWQ